MCLFPTVLVSCVSGLDFGDCLFLLVTFLVPNSIFGLWIRFSVCHCLWIKFSVSWIKFIAFGLLRPPRGVPQSQLSNRYLRLENEKDKKKQEESPSFDESDTPLDNKHFIDKSKSSHDQSRATSRPG